jgi:hypothetical protein
VILGVLVMTGIVAAGRREQKRGGVGACVAAGLRKFAPNPK